MFERTRAKLTAWYLVIIMAISLLFSVVIYSMVNAEFVRLESTQIRIQEDIIAGEFPPGPRFVTINPESIQRARNRLITTLGFVNLTILIISGGAGYFLAGRTLKPIKDSMDEQKRFVSDSSHEFRTPLTALRSEIEVGLRNKNLTSAEAKKILESNLEEVINLQTLSDNLLELAQGGKTAKTFMKPVSIKSIIQNAVKKIEPTAKNKGIKIENSVKEGKIKGAPDRLQELFVILLDNSIKYSPKRSTVYVKSQKSGGKIKISITDHGMGILKKDLPHIFDRFYRSDESRSKDGYGLGLSIAQKIVDAHNGEIEVESEPSKSTTFTINLPAAT